MAAIDTKIYVLNGEAREGEDPAQVHVLDAGKIKYPNDPPLKQRAPIQTVAGRNAPALMQNPLLPSQPISLPPSQPPSKPPTPAPPLSPTTTIHSPLSLNMMALQSSQPQAETLMHPRKAPIPPGGMRAASPTPQDAYRGQQQWNSEGEHNGAMGIHQRVETPESNKSNGSHGGGDAQTIASRLYNQYQSNGGRQSPASYAQRQMMDQQEGVGRQSPRRAASPLSNNAPSKPPMSYDDLRQRMSNDAPAYPQKTATPPHVERVKSPPIDERGSSLSRNAPSYPSLQTQDVETPLPSPVPMIALEDDAGNIHRQSDILTDDKLFYTPVKAQHDKKDKNGWDNDEDDREWERKRIQKKETKQQQQPKVREVAPPPPPAKDKPAAITKRDSRHNSIQRDSLYIAERMLLTTNTSTEADPAVLAEMGEPGTAKHEVYQLLISLSKELKETKACIMACH
jgi:hypothetical protein